MTVRPTIIIKERATTIRPADETNFTEHDCYKDADYYSSPSPTSPPSDSASPADSIGSEGATTSNPHTPSDPLPDPPRPSTFDLYELDAPISM
eukprot:6518117-Heterocapsa_arctica.AAC.1